MAGGWGTPQDVGPADIEEYSFSEFTRRVAEANAAGSNVVVLSSEGGKFRARVLTTGGC